MAGASIGTPSTKLSLALVVSLTRARLFRHKILGFSALLTPLLALGPLGRAPSRTDTSGIPFHELIGRALADASGEENQPPAVAKLEDLLGSDSFKQLTENPRIKQPVQVWAKAAR
jgi:hypothetical protein